MVEAGNHFRVDCTSILYVLEVFDVHADIRHVELRLYVYEINSVSVSPDSAVFLSQTLVCF